MKVFSLKPQIKGAFTLVEMLVAMAVFLVLAAVVMQMVFTTTQITQSQKQQMDSITEARQALDRIKLDWNSRVRRDDVMANFIKQNGNDQIQLLCQASSYDGTRKFLSAVSYRIREQRVNADDLLYVMERGVVGFDWQVTNTGTNTFAMPTFTSSSSKNDYELLAKSVFRLEFCFMKKVKNAGDSPYTTQIGDVREDNWQSLGLYDNGDITSLHLDSPNFSGLVVAVAVLDEKARKILSNAQLQELAESQALPDVNDGETPLAKWTPLITSLNNFPADIPRPAAGSVRVYQRVFYSNE
ncbi:MAG: type II secretion system GspH family protein [Verrucomicrobiales bacterium]|jgi:prepilin-type N-terminal cleavage/methylation domain-containing protein|nr:type II secretion system GspH family protein [Verrucomicrobiales bacterium]